ncbi:DNA alkylation repair protein [Naumannella halotolerans]|nr:DNA alkylation repair protein [Naumannella halotolerans]
MDAPTRAEHLRRLLDAAADPGIAAGQQAYMKSAMPFRGVRMPAVRRIVRDALAPRSAIPAGPGKVSSDDLLPIATLLWRGAQFREDRYAAITVLDLPPIRTSPATIPLSREMITTGAWWDLVDATASHVAKVLLTHRDELTPLMYDWAGDDDRWLRRSAIISQLGAKQRMDRVLLHSVIESNRTDPDFFIRKAIGWALRDFARTDPDWVRALTDQVELSPLSRREALKHLHLPV